MNRPHPFKYLLGSWPVVGLAGLMTAGAGYNWFLGIDSGMWILFAFFFAILSGTLKARSEVKDYQEWKARWDGYGKPARKRGPLWLTIGIVLTTPVAFWAILTVSDASESEGGRAVLAMIGLGLVLLVIVALIWRVSAAVGKARAVRRQAARAKAPIVGLCLKVPAADPQTLQKAYNSLPEHCYAVLRA